MTWVRLDENFPRHPKLAEVGPLGLAMQVGALCYCNQYLTDGYIPAAVAYTLFDFDGIAIGPSSRGRNGDFLAGPGYDVDGEMVATWMVEAGVWRKVKGGFRIHDYLDFQPSKEHVMAEREKKRLAGAIGGQARAKQRAKQTPKHEPSTSPSTIEAEPQAKSKPVPVPVPVSKTPPASPSPRDVEALVARTTDAIEEIPF